MSNLKIGEQCEIKNTRLYPKVTVILLAYNQEKYITEAVQSLLSQTHPNLELIFSDDCSSDKTYEIIRELTTAYNGPHKLIVNQNISNTGTSTAHLNKIFHLASGEWIVLAAGDDISEPNRVQCLVEAISKEENCTLVYSAKLVIDESGKTLINQWDGQRRCKLDEAFFLRGGTNILGAVLAFKRSAVSFFGNLPPNIRSEDKIIVFRCLLLGSIIYIEEPLVRYRRHSSNATEGDIHKARLSLSLSKYIASQIKKYKEQLACFLAFEEDLNLLLDSKIPHKINASEIVAALRGAIKMRKDYIHYLDNTSLGKTKCIFSIKNFAPILGVEKNKIIIVGAALWIFGPVINGAFFITQKLKTIIRNLLKSIFYL
jgi:glycosyltransferase involved in cell wall biosynthesis